MPPPLESFEEPNDALESMQECKLTQCGRELWFLKAPPAKLQVCDLTPRDMLPGGQVGQHQEAVEEQKAAHLRND